MAQSFYTLSLFALSFFSLLCCFAVLRDFCCFLFVLQRLWFTNIGGEWYTEWLYYVSLDDLLNEKKSGLFDRTDKVDLDEEQPMVESDQLEDDYDVDDLLKDTLSY